jgi:hypothetical protein
MTTGRRIVLLLLPALALCACQPAAILPTTAAPPACDLAGFGAAPGLDLATLKTRPKRGQEPSRAGAILVGQSIADTGAWVDAAPGWRTWRYWVRSETARSVSVRLDPFSLPPAAQLWVCSPDRTTRQGPVTGKGYGDVGRYGSPEVMGPELWLEVLAPAGAEKDVQLVITEAFAAQR